MADHKKEITLTDLQQKILSNDLYNDTDNAGIDDWIQKAVDGKINNCWKRFQNEWTTKLINDDSSQRWLIQPTLYKKSSGFVEDENELKSRFNNKVPKNIYDTWSLLR